MDSARFNPPGTVRVFQIMAAYLAICGLSAVLWPSAWMWASGIQGQNLDLGLAVAGVMMCGLAVLSWQARNDRNCRAAAIAALLIAHCGDAGIVAFFTAQGRLPIFNGLTFLIVDMAWIIMLLRIRK